MQSNDSSNSNQAKIGRFAPSPTGALHFGSLIAAIASYLCARQHYDGQWLLRIEDVDIERKQKGATTSILHALEAYAFKWDGEVTYQSQRTEHYQTALDSISEHVYPCSCTRKYLQALSTNMTYGYNYPGLCRNGIQNKDVKNPSIRILTNNSATDSISTSNHKICFQDECQPEYFCQDIEADIGDFILKRRDGLFAYQLAVVVDDHLQRVNHVVRGADLFDNTPRQIYLQQLLGYQTPDYLHFPVATTADGRKLSKQNLSTEITLRDTSLMLQTLINGLQFLGQSPPKLSEFSSLEDFWKWAITHWNRDNIPKVMNIVYDA